MSQDLLFEIGAEEIPATYIQPALDQMKAAAEAFLHECRLSQRLHLVQGGLDVRSRDLLGADLEQQVLAHDSPPVLGKSGWPRSSLSFK